MNITPEQARVELARRELVKRGVPLKKSQEIAQSIPDAVTSSLIGSTKVASDMITGQREGTVNMAKALPFLAGIVGGGSPIPGGATMGTVGGRQLSNMALRIYGRPEEIPSTSEQVAEGTLAALGDVAAIPMIKKSHFGSEIGKVEKMAGVPQSEDIPSIPMATGTKTIGEFINDAVNSVKSSGMEGTPSYWMQIKDQIDRLYKIGKDEALTNLDKGRLKWLSAKVQEGLNTSVPGRSIPAEALARSQTIPNTIARGYKAIPRPVKQLVGLGVAGTLADALGRRLSR